MPFTETFTSIGKKSMPYQKMEKYMSKDYGTVTRENETQQDESPELNLGSTFEKFQNDQGDPFKNAYLSFATKKNLNVTETDFSIPEEVSRVSQRQTTNFMTIPTELPLITSQDFSIPIEQSANFSKDELTKFLPSFPVTKSAEGTFEGIESLSSVEKIG